MTPPGKGLLRPPPVPHPMTGKPSPSPLYGLDWTVMPPVGLGSPAWHQGLLTPPQPTAPGVSAEPPGEMGAEEDQAGSGALPPYLALQAGAQNLLQKERASGDETAVPHPWASVQPGLQRPESLVEKAAWLGPSSSGSLLPPPAWPSPFLLPIFLPFFPFWG